MGDSLHQEHLKVKEHIATDFPKEICGVFTGKNLNYHPISNIAEDDDEFVMDPKEYTRIRLTKDVVAIVHSHNGPAKASDWDIAQCNSHKLPFVIYGDDMINVIYPKKHALEGRLYTFGVLDCFEAVRDWYESKGVKSPPRLPWEDDWFNKGLNYIDQYCHRWGLKEVKDNSLEYGDVLVFKKFAPVPDHLGVYTGDDQFFHHAHGRISCYENLYDYWAEYLVKVLRHDEARSLRR